MCTGQRRRGLAAGAVIFGAAWELLRCGTRSTRQRREGTSATPPPRTIVAERAGRALDARSALVRLPEGDEPLEVRGERSGEPIVLTYRRDDR